MITDFLIRKSAKEKIDPEDLNIRKRLGMLSGVVGIICNMLLSIFKFFAGVITSSIAISADGFNNLSDAISSIVTLICFKTSSSPADKKHPFGYGRIEYVSGLIVSIAIIFMGIELTKSSVEKIFSPESATNPDVIALIILSVSMLIKLWLGFFNRKIGKVINSTAMRATAFDCFGDVIVTAALFIGMTITYFTGISIDSYLGIGVALFIISNGIKMLKETLSPILGQSPDPEFVKKIYETVKLYPQILGVHQLLIHSYGPGRSFISFHAEVPADRSIMEIHEEIDNLEELLKEKFKCQAIIHMDPIINDDEAVNQVKEKLISASKLVCENTKIYDLRIVPGNTRKLVFNLAVPYDLDKTNDEIEKIISGELKKMNFDCAANIERHYFD